MVCFWKRITTSFSFFPPVENKWDLMWKKKAVFSTFWHTDICKCSLVSRTGQNQDWHINVIIKHTELKWNGSLLHIWCSFFLRTVSYFWFWFASPHMYKPTAEYKGALGKLSLQYLYWNIEIYVKWMVTVADLQAIVVPDLWGYRSDVSALSALQPVIQWEMIKSTQCGVTF